MHVCSGSARPHAQRLPFACIPSPAERSITIQFESIQPPFQSPLSLNLLTRRSESSRLQSRRYADDLCLPLLQLLLVPPLSVPNKHNNYLLWGRTVRGGATNLTDANPLVIEKKNTPKGPPKSPQTIPKSIPNFIFFDVFFFRIFDVFYYYYYYYYYYYLKI